MSKCLVSLLFLLFSGITLTPLQGQTAEYPNRSIRLVVPFPPGGTNDAMARVIAKQVEEQMHQPIVIENRPGANGMIGFEQVAKAAADGYTLLHTAPSIVINEFVYKNRRYDLDRDFVPITNLALGSGYLVLANPASGIESVKDLVRLAKGNAKLLAYGSAGQGNTTHLAAELMRARLGIELLHVPYKGLSEAMNGAVSGDVQIVVTPPPLALPFIEAGRLRPIAFTGEERWPVLADVPTLSESGASGLSILGGWFGWFAPKGTPNTVVQRLQKEVERALKEPSVKAFVDKSGYQVDGRNPAEFVQFLESERLRYREAVRAAGVEPL